MRYRIMALIAGALFLIAIGAAGNAQASTSRLSAPQTGLQPSVTDCSPIYGVGNGNKWSFIAGDGTLHFNSTGTRTSFCVKDVGFDGDYEVIELMDGSGCLDINASSFNGHQGIVGLDGASECNYEVSCFKASTCAPAHQYDLWDVNEPDNAGSPYDFVLANRYPTGGVGWCLYDNTQEPAIYTSCTGYNTDKFMWFYWPVAVFG